jgi:hypothetical protein
MLVGRSWVHEFSLSSHDGLSAFTLRAWGSGREKCFERVYSRLKPGVKQLDLV